jgi:hypothetical protein
MFLFFLQILGVWHFAFKLRNGIPFGGGIMQFDMPVKGRLSGYSSRVG